MKDHETELGLGFNERGGDVPWTWVGEGEESVTVTADRKRRNLDDWIDDFWGRQRISLLLSYFSSYRVRGYANSHPLGK